MGDDGVPTDRTESLDGDGRPLIGDPMPLICPFPSPPPLDKVVEFAFA